MKKTLIIAFMVAAISMPLLSDPLVVYFSRSGNTESVAERIAERVDADVFEIETVQEYPLDHDPLVDMAAEEQDKYVIGTSLAMVDGDHSLCTSMKYVQQMVLAECQALLDGTWGARTDVYGIKDGVCDYSLEGVNTEIPQDIIDQLDEIKALISEGTLVLPTEIDAVDAWVAENSPAA